MSTVPKYEMITVDGVEMTLLSRTRDSLTGDVHVQTARYLGETLVLESFVCGDLDLSWRSQNRMELNPRALRIVASL